MKSEYATARLALVLALGCLLGVVLMSGGAACQQPTGAAREAACTTDEDCPEGQVCQDGECVEPAPPCETDADCDDGLFCNGVETCVDNVCQAGTDPCEAGQDCDEENDVCVAVGASPYAEAVAFDHPEHQTDVADCASCHHAEPNAAGQGCDVCHADEWLGGVPKLKEAQHWTCRTCHDAQAGEAVRCDTCHTALKSL